MGWSSATTTRPAGRHALQVGRRPRSASAGRSGRNGHRTGTQHRTSVPRPGRPSISTRPPTSAIRPRTERRRPPPLGGGAGSKPAPSSLTEQNSSPSSGSANTVTVGAAVLAGVGQRLAHRAGHGVDRRSGGRRACPGPAPPGRCRRSGPRSGRRRARSRAPRSPPPARAPGAERNSRSSRSCSCASRTMSGSAVRRWTTARV